MGAIQDALARRRIVSLIEQDGPNHVPPTTGVVDYVGPAQQIKGEDDNDGNAYQLSEDDEDGPKSQMGSALSKRRLYTGDVDIDIAAAKPKKPAK